MCICCNTDSSTVARITQWRRSHAFDCTRRRSVQPSTVNSSASIILVPACVNVLDRGGTFSQAADALFRRDSTASRKRNTISSHCKTTAAGGRTHKTQQRTSQPELCCSHDQPGWNLVQQIVALDTPYTFKTLHHGHIDHLRGRALPVSFRCLRARESTTAQHHNIHVIFPIHFSPNHFIPFF